MFKIAIGSDHRGYEHKLVLQAGLSIETRHIEWIDVGAFSRERSDYPPFAHDVVDALKHNRATHGILICGSGVGMAVAANRFAHIYAGLVWNEESARRSKEEDNTNVLVLPSDFVSPSMCIAIASVWLEAQFKGGRYAQRIAMIDAWGGL